MKISFNEKLIAYLALLSGLAISTVAIYYSVSGLTAIFAGAVIPIIIMGVTLEVSKIVASIWLKQNWGTAPQLIKLYLSIAVALLMVITSTGIFGFLSQAHISQNAPAAEVSANVAIIDEKIKTQRDNIDVSRKSLAQMDATVDQTISRSTNERGAATAAALRKSQLRERAALQSDINKAQKEISVLNTERAPVATALRKVEAEVGPIKYIAAFFYGVTDPTVLEKAVTWVIILIIVVFDPLALILLIASQVSFQRFREQKSIDDASVPVALVMSAEPIVEEITVPDAVVESAVDETDILPYPAIVDPELVLVDKYDQDDGELTTEQLEQIRSIVATEDEFFKQDQSIAESIITAETSAVVENYSPNWPPHNYVQAPAELLAKPLKEVFLPSPTPNQPVHLSTRPAAKIKVFPRPVPIEGYVQNEEQTESNLWTATTNTGTNVISHDEYMHASQEKFEEYVTDTAALVRAGRLEMSEVPVALLAEVKARV